MEGVNGVAARLVASSAALQNGPIRLSRWAYLCSLFCAASLVLSIYLLVDLSTLRRALGRESTLLHARLDSMNVAVTNDFNALAPAARDGCTAALRQRLVRVSLQSGFARAFFVRRPGDSLWCGPLGFKVFHGAPVLARPASGFDTRTTLVRETRLSEVYIATVRHRRGVLLAAEVDSRFLDALSSEAFEGEPRWDHAGSGDIGVRVRWLGRHALVSGSRLLFERRAASDRHGMVLVQSVTVRHLVRRALQSGPLLVAVILLLALVGGVLANRVVLNRASPHHRLWLALRKRRFEPLVQPIVELSTGRCIGGEVLMRWAHPVRGLLPPSEFILLAEETGMIVPMSDLVMIKARDRLAPLTRQHPGMYFSFNIIPAQLRDPAFAERLSQIFDVASLQRENLLLEVTEREFLDESSGRALCALKHAGYRLAIDDFGTGHSSLATLETLPLDRLKIDREFVRTIDDDTITRPVLDSIIALAHSLGIPIIAEGVETQKQWDYLAARGVQYVQGFLVARPMPTKEFARWLGARQADVPAPGEHGARHAVLPSTPPDAAAWGTRESDESQRLASLDSDQLVAEMRGVTGVETRDRMQMLLRHPACFVGSEAVDWLSAQLQISRRSAVRVGQRLVALGYVHHVAEEYDFADGYLFYRFSESAAPAAPAADGIGLPELGHVLRAMRSAGGVMPRTHLRRLVRYEGCFSGREACAWLMRHFNVSGPIALWLGRELMKNAGLRHVFDDRPFTDSDELYRFL
jgi:EAL domain-containing protein (putative c-di-GMP-specific phosphodiesterase class I)